MAGAMNKSVDDLTWRARDALNTIHRASEHQKDAKLMREVKRIASEQMAATSAVEKRDSGGEKKRMAEKPAGPGKMGKR